MIIDKIIKVKNKPYYIKIGYDKNLKMINVKIDDIRPNSHIKIKVKCDYCGNEKELSYVKYLKNTKSNTLPYACSHKCSVEKLMNTFNERFGCVSSQHPDIKLKQLETMMKKYGEKSPLCNEDIKQKAQKTCLIKYGVKNASQSDVIKSKKIETTLKNYGVENPSQADSIKNKKCETMVKNYGVKYVFQSDELRNNIKKTKLEKYGNENYNNRNSSIKTCIKKFGVENVSQNDNINSKKQKSLFFRKEFETFTYQGTYELDFLEKYHKIVKKYKSIKYTFQEKERVYFPDFYQETLNLIIEIKSHYTYEKELEKNLAKQKACIEQGYKFIFIIDKNYEEFDHIVSVLSIK